MSRRGGKRRTVLQLGNSSSKLHRYGYSKEFHSKDKKGSAPTLVGAYSDSESDDDSEHEQQATGEMPELENGEAADAAATTMPSERKDEDGQVPAAHMDDELKNFLSEIEAIPMPVDMMTAPAEQSQPSETNDGLEETESGETEHENNTSAKSKSRYSMFVKGEPEFVNNTKVDNANEKGEKKDTETKDLLSEIPIEPTTNWQMVQDETTQYYYYWNVVTNEVTWEIPTEYTQFLLLHKEYEEKLAKFTPQQLQAIKDRAQRLLATDSASGQASTTATSAQEGMRRSDSSLSALSAYSKDDTEDQSKRDTVTERLSPLPDSSRDSHHRKHKKEKRSHHKKKHKRRHSDSDSDGSNKPSPKMPDLDPSSLSETVEKTSSSNQKLTSIVPYLSDQDDDDNNENENSNPVPELLMSSGPKLSEDGISENDAALPELGPSMKPAEFPLSQEPSLTQSEDTVGIDPSILLLPPPPPPPEEEDGDNSQTGHVETERVSQKEIVSENGEAISKNVNSESSNGLVEAELQSGVSAPHDVNEILDAIAQPAKAGVEEKTVDVKLEEIEGNSLSKVIQDTMKEDRIEEKRRPQETLKVDMFAEDYPPLNMTNSPGLESRDSSSRDGADMTEDKKEAYEKERIDASMEKIGAVEESMEEGELSEASEKENTNSAKSKKAEKDVDETRNKKKSSNVLNIVGYGSDDEEEEGEVKDYEMKEERHSTKKKKKDKKKDWKKNKKDSTPDYSFMDGKLDKEILSKMSDTIDQTISKIVTQTVNQAVSGLASEKPTVSAQEDGEIDFEDLDDIDRALEVALEKKLEKRKVGVSQPDEKEKLRDDMTVTELTSSTLAKRGEEKDQTALTVKEGSPVHISKKSKYDEKTPTSTENNEDNLKAEIKEMADLALSKLEFLDISTDSLSRLQILFIELQTRQTDWLAGGLSSQYFYEQLKVAESLLKQYELSAVPEGWACQWDRANNRYYYRNKQTNRIQWEYPQVEEGSKGSRTASSSKEEGATKVADTSVEDQHKSRSSGSSRHRKRDEKDRSKYDKRSSSHRYRRKRRRRRDHSTSSNSSDGSQQHRRHKSKKKKRHRSERSPSVEIVEDIDGIDMDDVEITEAAMAQPNSSSQPASNGATPPPVAPTVEATMDEVPPPQSTDLPPTEDSTAIEDTSKQLEEERMEEEGEEKDSKEEESQEPANTVVISKPPQIVVPPQIAAAIHPTELHPGADLYSASQISAAALPKSSSTPVDKNPAASEAASESTDGQGDADKQSKKKKKDKKPLAAGSSIMMKKKHLSSMVQKWQNVKKEVEKEDRAKELRQAAIRKKIEELK